MCILLYVPDVLKTHNAEIFLVSIWQISPRAGIDCYWLGQFLVCSEAYKVVDLFAKFLYFCVCVIFLVVRSLSTLFTSFTCLTCLKWSLNLAINENMYFEVHLNVVCSNLQIICATFMTRLEKPLKLSFQNYLWNNHCLAKSGAYRVFFCVRWKLL